MEKEWYKFHLSIFTVKFGSHDNEKMIFNNYMGWTMNGMNWWKKFRQACSILLQPAKQKEQFPFSFSDNGALSSSEVSKTGVVFLDSISLSQ